MGNGKYPYFRLFVNDLEGSFWVQTMNERQFSWYMRLLIRSWHADKPCHLPNDDDVLFALSRCDNRTYFDKHFKIVKDRFEVTEDGKYLVNKRLLEEYEYVHGVSERMAELGRKRASSGGKACAERTLSVGNESYSDTESDSESELDIPIKEVWDYYIERLGRNEKIYTFTPKRKQKGISRLKECLAITDGDIGKAKDLMKLAIDKLADSKFHNGQNDSGKKYISWEDHLFKSAEKLQEWWER